MNIKTTKVIEACEEGTYAVTDYKTSKSKMLVSCINGHTREVTPEKVWTRGDKTHCKICGTKPHGLSKNEDTFREECLAHGLTLIDKYINNHTRVMVKNISCGHIYDISPNSLLSKGSGGTCMVCNPVINKSKGAFFSLIKDKGLSLVGEYLGTMHRVEIKNNICGCTYTVDPSTIMYKDGGYSCKTCAPINRKPEEEVKDLLNKLNLTLVGEYKGTKSNILVKNNACGHEYKILATNVFYKGQGVSCPLCNPTCSTEEFELLSFIRREYTGWIISGERDILEGKELDIVLPDLGIAFEYNGSYWHRETDIRDKDYHLNKLIGVENFEYQLITITDIEWNTKRDIVESRILSLLGKSEKIYARNTTVKEIPFPRGFLSRNHIQGVGAISPINFGLFLKDDLIAVMTFGTPRYTEKYNYELLRYCSALGTTVVGGASKLLTAFKRKYLGSIISYANRRWSKGNLYNKLGFKFSHNSTPSYIYVKGTKVLSRYQCQKHLLKQLFAEFYKDELSETKIMELAGYSKVFDCGNSVWTLE